MEKVNVKGKVRSYLSPYPVLGLLKELYTSPPGRPVHSNVNAASLGSIQRRHNYCDKTVFTFPPGAQLND